MRLNYFIPCLLFLALLMILGRALFYTKPNELPSALLGEKVPSFTLPILFHSEKKMTQNDFLGKVSLLNVWATWCYACQVEHNMLIKIARDYHIPIYSIDYKDDPNEAKKWLTKFGNPYVMIGNDKYGDVAIDLGVYGTPETFIISPQGNIVYRHIGVIDQKTWENVLYPIVRRYEG